MAEKFFMIIDDDTDDRIFFKEALNEIFPSAACLEANGGIEALQLLQKTEQLPDFIFLDINMPRMDGQECLKELKKVEKLNSIPVIMYSTFFSEERIDEFRKIGASSYLTKPTDMNKLPEQVLEAIKKSTDLSIYNK